MESFVVESCVVEALLRNLCCGIIDVEDMLWKLCCVFVVESLVWSL